MIEEMKHVFGIVSMSPAIRVDKDIAACEEACRSVVAGKTGTFKVQAHRSDKSFPMNSPELNAHLGGIVLKSNPNLKVDVKDPDFILYIEVKKYIYIYTERIEGTGGLPSGSSGRGLYSYRAASTRRSQAISWRDAAWNSDVCTSTRIPLHPFAGRKRRKTSLASWRSIRDR